MHVLSADGAVPCCSYALQVLCAHPWCLSSGIIWVQELAGSDTHWQRLEQRMLTVHDRA